MVSPHVEEIQPHSWFILILAIMMFDPVIGRLLVFAAS
jgi:hypothetical protein